MHAGYSLWCSLSMFEHSPFVLLRVLAVAYPFLTLYCIVVTANHFFLDAVLGAVCYYVAMKVAPYLPKMGRGAQISGYDLINGGTLKAGGNCHGSKELEMDEEALIPVTVADLQQSQQPAVVGGGIYGPPGNSLLKKR